MGISSGCPLFLSNAELLFAAEALAVNGETTRWTLMV